MKKSKMFGVRLPKDLAQWIETKAKENHSTVSQTLIETLRFAKQQQEIPEAYRYSKILPVQGSKAAMMTYRLLENLVIEVSKNGKASIQKAFETAAKDIAEWKA